MKRHSELDRLDGGYGLPKDGYPECGAFVMALSGFLGTDSRPTEMRRFAGADPLHLWHLFPQARNLRGRAGALR